MSARAVFDCMTFLQAAVNDAGPAFACLRHAEAGRVALCVSAAVLAEVQDVLTRPKLQRKFPHLAERVEPFLGRVREVAVVIDDVPAAFKYARDPDDEPYINLALAVGATYLVTWDNDLLDLMDERKPEGRDFRARFPTLRALTPVMFLREFAPPAGGPESRDSPGQAPPAV